MCDLCGVVIGRLSNILPCTRMHGLGLGNCAQPHINSGIVSECGYMRVSKSGGRSRGV